MKKVLFLLLIIITFFSFKKTVSAGTCGRTWIQGGREYRTMCSSSVQTSSPRHIPELTCDQPNQICVKTTPVQPRCERDPYYDSSGDGFITFCSLIQVGVGISSEHTGCGLGQQCFIGSALGENSAEWTVDDDGLKLCYGGFETQEDLNNSRIEFRCTSNCGGSARGNPPIQTFQTPNLIFDGENANAARSEEGYWSCIVPQIDNSVRQAITWQVTTGHAACITAGATLVSAGVATGSLLAGGAAVLVGTQASITIPVVITSTAQVAAGGAAGAGVLNPILGHLQECVDSANNYSPTIRATIFDQSNNALATREITIRLNAQGSYEVGGTNTGSNITPGQIIERAENRFQIQECTVGISNSTSEILRESGGKGIQTAFGCLPTSISGLTRFIFSIATGIGGGIAFLLILLGGMKIVMSTGDPKKLQEGRDLVTSAVVGLLVILFSVIILRIIGINILGIPGFGGTQGTTQTSPTLR